MTEMWRRLVYGPLPWAGYEGIIMAADVAERWAAVADATTLAEFQRLFYGQTWDEYVAELTRTEDEPAPSADEPFSFADWFVESGELGPPDEGWAVAHRRVAEIVAAEPELLRSIESGGGSPGGNMDAITGTIEALGHVAAKIDPTRDGFTLERDDTTVQAAWPRRLFE